jgi:hypothetical protein
VARWPRSSSSELEVRSVGSRGPVPKPSDQRRRRNKTDASGAPNEVTADESSSSGAKAPRVNGNWHPVAKRFYAALRSSGQARYYQPSDWAVAELLCESISRELRSKEPPKAASVQAWLKGAAVLMATEGDRRRLRMELHVRLGAGEGSGSPAPADGEGGEGVEDPAAAGRVVWLADARARAAGEQ